MAEEFQESEVIFHYGGDEDDGENRFDFEEMIVSTRHGRLSSNNKSSSSTNKKKKKKKGMANSMPVNIPDNIFQLEENKNDCFDLEEWDDDDGNNGELVPPHLIVRRRIAGGKMAYSVCTGNGRTLKGRDLSQVRNSILRMTGFLET